MTTRQFDPVLSAALRNELEALAEQEDAPPRRPVLHRPQVWISVVTAILLVLATVGVLRLTGGGVPPAVEPTDAGTPTLSAAGVADPLAEILYSRGDAYIRALPDVLLRTNGTGPGTWSVTIPEGVTSVRPYVDCAPHATYTLGIDGPSGVTAACAPTFAGSFGDIPVRAGQHTVSLRVPKGRAFALLLIATPTYTPSSAGPARPLLPYPSVTGQDLLARARGDAGIVRGRLSGSMTGVLVRITCEGDGTVTVATDFGTAGNPADFSACRSTTAKPRSSGVGLSGEDSIDRPRYTITPYGDVRWTVTITRLDD